jgi:hypothetical protein
MLTRLGLTLIAISAVAFSHAQAATRPPAKEADVKSMESILAALYDVISGPAGQKRDWNRMRSLFVEGAQMSAVGKRPDGQAVRRAFTVEDYITRSGPVLEQRGFFEKEVARRIESFGNIAHVFSTYEAREKSDDAKPMMRGINSIQLFNDGKRWWIVSIYWQAEDPSTQLPDKYLKGSGL